MRNIGKVLIGILVLFCFVSPVHALSLEEAKARGYVGEQQDGYLGVVQSNPAAAKLVSEINNKRKAQYQEIARKNGTQLSAVEALAGRKAIGKTAAGNYIMVPGKGWQKK